VYVERIEGDGGQSDPVARLPAPPRLAHQPALDGLRGLAVLAVLAYHQNFGAGWARGGYLGVDIFFVLSGFLITSLLLIDHERTGRVVSGEFWARRARRLFPALLVLLVMAAAYAAFIAKPWQLHELRATAIATLLYVNNFWQMNPAHRVGPLVLDHTWSLSIEEQFYFVWPVLLAGLLLVTRGRRSLVVALGGLAAASAIWMAVVYRETDIWRAYFGTDTRAHSLLIGAALGVAILGWSGPRTRRTRVALEIAGGVALVFLTVVILVCGLETSPWLYRGGFLLIAIASATVIAAAVQSGSPVVGRGLAARPLAAVGLISYGLYLFHPPIYAWLTPDRVGVRGVPLFALRLAVTFAVATASFVLLERPIRRGAFSWRLRVVAPVAALVVVGLVLVATLGARPVPSSELVALHYRRLASAAPHDAVRVLVVGDSAAFGLGRGSGDAFSVDGIFGTTASVPDCGVGAGDVVYLGTVRPQPDCRTWPRVYRTAVENFTPHATVLMLGPATLLDRVVGGRTLHVGTPEFAAYFTQQLEQARRVLTAEGAPLVILTLPCADGDGGQSAPINTVLRQFAAAHPKDVSVADYDALLCLRGHPRPTVDGHAARGADQLLTEAGAATTWKWLARTGTIGDRARAARAGS
jgi:peptidoglycan/LPS O-acetylase OafA/YrhL